MEGVCSLSLQLGGLLSEYKNVVCGALSVVVVKEMKAAFDSLWTTMVMVRPPWSLREVITILDK
jgi:hypothetical protein